MADGTTIRATYDVYGNITAKTIDNRPVEQYTYDNRGNLARKIDRQANLTTTYDYNNTGKLVRSAVYTGDTATQTPESRMQYTYTKGGNIGTLSYQEKGDATRTYTYEYATDDKPTKATLPDKSVLTYSYDSLRRSNKTVYTPKSGVADSKKLYTTLQYQPSQFTVDGKTKNTTTDLVSTYTNKFGGSGTPVSEFTYTYDAWGNITNIKDQSARQKTYTYNEYGEITKATEAYANAAATTYTYTYDNGGNILTETRGSTRHTYTYDSVWKDKLIAYDGKTITYDRQGRPTNYLGKTMTWDNTGHLTAIDNTSNGTIRYTYLSDGQRYTKTVNGKTTTYHYNNGLLLSEQTGDETLRYYYDATGKVTSFTYKKGSNAEVSYFYTRNLQGDIIAIYRSSDSALIGTYEYDLWGRLVSETEATKGIDTDSILAKNPFRYRGYYYDTETGFYNLNARYYDPEIRRFISPDDMIASVGTSVQGHNLFGYCFNNPVNMADPSGHWPRKITANIAAVALIVAGAGMFAGPVVAISAASVAIAASAGYALQTAHYDVRKSLNADIPLERDDALAAGWYGPGAEQPGPSAACHQYTATDGKNDKYVSPDGHREAIYNSEGYLVLDSRDIGTYNFSPSGTFTGSIGHFFCDIVPWFIFGNDDDDPGPIINGWNSLFN